MLKKTIKTGVICLAAVVGTGCVVYERPRPVAVVETPVGPGVEVIEVEPAPTERVYVYEVGYPPGVYVYGGYYYYGGHRYEHDVFVNRVVTVNIRENRYVNVEENHRAGQRIEMQHRQAYAANADHRRPAEAHPAARPGTSADANAGHAPAPRPAANARPRQGTQATAQ